MNYGFDIEMGTKILDQLKKLETQMEATTTKVTKEVQHISESFKEMEKAVQSAGRYIMEAFALDRIYEFGKEILTVTAEFEGFRNVIKYASMNAYDAGENLEYIEDAVKRLHLPIKEAIESFSEMQAGFYGTGIEGDRLRKVFEGVSTAATVLHLSAYRFGNVTFALKEIGELGTLQARQMRMLAFSLPGAMNLAAKAMHLSTQQFHEAMKKGEISSGHFLEAFSAQLQEHFSKGLSNAGNSLISKMNDTKNAFTERMLDMGEKLRPTFITIMNGVISAFDSAPVKLFIEHLDTLVTVGGKLLAVWAGYKAVMIGVGLATKVAAYFTKAFGQTLELSTIQGKIFTTAMSQASIAASGLATVLIDVGLAGFALGLGYVIEKFIEMNSEFDKSIEKATHLQEMTTAFDDIEKTNNRINYYFGNRANNTPEENSQMYTEIEGAAKKVGDHLKVAADNLKAAKFERATWAEPKRMEGESEVAFSGRLEQSWKTKNALDENLVKLNQQFEKEQVDKWGYGMKLKALQGEGVKPFKGAPLPTTGAGATGEALSTMNLSGAKGGLGEAKTINIHFHDALQKVTVGVPAQLKEAGQQAVEVIVRAINNLAYQQARSM